MKATFEGLHTQYSHTNRWTIAIHWTINTSGPLSRTDATTDTTNCDFLDNPCMIRRTGQGSMFDRLTGVRSTKRDSVSARASSRAERAATDEWRRRRLPLDLRRPDCLAMTMIIFREWMVVSRGLIRSDRIWIELWNRHNQNRVRPRPPNTSLYSTHSLAQQTIWWIVSISLCTCENRIKESVSI